MKSNSQTVPASIRQVNPWLWFGPLIYMVGVGTYFIIRYGGHWSESDSATFSVMIRAMSQQGQLIPDQDVYSNGFAFQALSTIILAVTGLSISALQQLVYPLVAALAVLPAWALYRELTGSARGATFATMLLFTQPEFLFVMLRSSHEKFTRTLLLLCMYWLVRSFKLRDRPMQFALYVGLFYLTSFALITSNNLLAHSFIFTIGSALAGAWLLEKRRTPQPAGGSSLLQRLPYAMVICLGLDYLFTFYAYPPAQHDLLILQSIWDRLAALLLDVHAQSSNPYAAVQAGWISFPVYLMVSIANWIILATSCVIWLRQGIGWVWKRQAPTTEAARLLWLFYASFVVQGAGSVVADTGGLLGSNLQLRLFSSFSIIAVAMVGSALAAWRPARFAGAWRMGLAALAMCIAALSVWKATNEPLLSNKWVFYQPEELVPFAWADPHLRSAEIWTEFDERLSTAYTIEHGDSNFGNAFTNDLTVQPTTRNILLTDVTRWRSDRLRVSLPATAGELKVYDSGEAQLYHMRPRTPYQR